jgi:hypothetical protein
MVFFVHIVFPTIGQLYKGKTKRKEVLTNMDPSKEITCANRPLSIQQKGNKIQF